MTSRLPTTRSWLCAARRRALHTLALPSPARNDLILAPDPGYPIFSFGPMMTGATVGLYPLYAEKNWQLDFNDIPEDVAERAKAIVVSYPNNPTTAVADRKFYEKLVLWAREHNIIVLHDNAYSDIMLNGGKMVCPSCPFRARRRSALSSTRCPRPTT